MPWQRLSVGAMAAVEFRSACSADSGVLTALKFWSAGNTLCVWSVDSVGVFKCWQCWSAGSVEVLAVWGW